MKTVLCVFGTRPEAIKMAPVVHSLRSRPESCRALVCVTAQHREMLDQVLHLFGISPDFDLDVMRPDQTPAGVAAAVLAGLGPVFTAVRPDWVLVQGDTTTVAAAALAAFYDGIGVGHVEAGLRTRDRRQPFPEEINRRIAGVVADRHFAPTHRAQANLVAEQVNPGNVLVTGNTVIDALQWVSNRIGDCPTEEDRFAGTAGDAGRLVLVTAHRRENFGPPLEGICQAVSNLVDRFGPKLRFLMPVHPNPRVQGVVQDRLGALPTVSLVGPLDYFSLVAALRQASLVLTDSGGLQEEAPAFGVPVLVLREVTERPEAVEWGVARLVGTDPDRITAEAVRLLTDTAAYARMARASNPFGDGRAAGRIADSLLGRAVEPFVPPVRQ